MRFVTAIVSSSLCAAIAACSAPASRAVGQAPTSKATTHAVVAAPPATTGPTIGAEDVATMERARAADPDYFAKPLADGLPPLHRAAMRGDAAMVRRMLELGANADRRVPTTRPTMPRPPRRDDTVTPLTAALGGAADDANRRGFPPKGYPGEWTMVDRRRRERETRGTPDPDRGPMQFVEVEQLLLANGADARAADPADGLTPLHLAILSVNVELVRPLLAAGADPNAILQARGTVAQTPLSFAAGTGDVELVRTLLDAGADPARVPEASRGNFLMRAMPNVEVLRLLLDRGMVLPPRALATAVRENNADAVAEIQRRVGATSPAERDAALYTAIRSAGHDELSPTKAAQLLAAVRSLLDSGASPSAPDGTGEALVEAIANDRTEVATLLKERGAKVDWSRLKDREHQPTKLAYNAAFMNRLEPLRQFEALGMPLDVWGAAILGRADRLKQLVAANKSLVAGEAGGTPLYFAAAYGRADCVRVLLDAGVEANVRLPSWDAPDIGPRPLDSAASGGHADVVRLLLDRGAKPSLMTLDDDARAKLTPDVRAMLAASR